MSYGKPFPIARLFLFFFQKLHELIVVAPQLLMLVQQLQDGEYSNALDVEAACFFRHLLDASVTFCREML